MSTTLSTFCLINAFFVNSIHFVLSWIKTSLLQAFLSDDNDSFYSNFLRVHVFNAPLILPVEVVESQQEQHQQYDVDSSSSDDEASFYATQCDQVFQQQQKVKFDQFHDSLENLRTSKRTFLSADHATIFSKDPYSSHFPDVAEVFNTNYINKNFRLHFE